MPAGSRAWGLGLRIYLEFSNRVLVLNLGVGQGMAYWVAGVQTKGIRFYGDVVISVVTFIIVVPH